MMVALVTILQLSYEFELRLL